MSTKHSPAKKSTKTPSICRKGVVGLPSVYVDGLPTSLSCFGMATETSGYDRISASFRLAWVASRRHWIGASDETGRNVQVIVTALPEPNKFEHELNVRDGDMVIGHFAWDSVHIDPGPPWNSGLLVSPPGPELEKFELHVLN